MGKNGLNIAIVGKDVSQPNAYFLVEKSLKLAAASSRIEINIIYVDSHLVNKDNASDLLSNMNGILIPGGFTADGVEGMIIAIEYARTNDVPFFGICLGMQLTIIEFARNVAGLINATSSEFDSNSSSKLIDHLPSLKEGELREGIFRCTLKEGSLIEHSYQASVVEETFRHGYNFNNAYREILKDNGLIISATSNDDKYVEAVELNNHPFFLGVQFHPEQTNVEEAHPLFLAFLEATFNNRKQ